MATWPPLVNGWVDVVLSNAGYAPPSLPQGSLMLWGYLGKGEPAPSDDLDKVPSKDRPDFILRLYRTIQLTDYFQFQFKDLLHIVSLEGYHPLAGAVVWFKPDVKLEYVNPVSEQQLQASFLQGYISGRPLAQPLGGPLGLPGGLGVPGGGVTLNCNIGGGVTLNCNGGGVTLNCNGGGVTLNCNGGGVTLNCNGGGVSFFACP